MRIRMERGSEEVEVKRRGSVVNSKWVEEK